MRRLLLLFTVLLAIFIVLHRQRLFLWDPLATVTRGGVKDAEAQASINFSNDLLLQDRSGGRLRVYLLQHGNPGPIAPTVLKCLGSALCLSDADHATGDAINVPRNAATPTMTDREVRFVDEDGQPVQIKLR